MALIRGSVRPPRSDLIGAGEVLPWWGCIEQYGSFCYRASNKGVNVGDGGTPVKVRSAMETKRLVRTQKSRGGR